MKKPSIASLLAEVEALKKKVAELEARPASQVVYHYYHQQPTYTPIPNSPYLPQLSPTCQGGSVTAPAGHTLLLSGICDISVTRSSLVNFIN